jgi:hypothetical protein
VGAATGEAITAPTVALMKSRRRIAFPKAGTTPIKTRLQQGFATSEMGFSGHIAWQQFCVADVRFGSFATDAFRARAEQCPLCAVSDQNGAVLRTQRDLA